MKQYKIANNVIGWLIFAIAAFTYCSTVEPSASFWDCPEFITTAYKLEVGHPPGAPFFMLTANFFTHFAKDPTHVAIMVNIMSALLSAFCILFLFWTITHLGRMLIGKDGQVTQTSDIIKIMGAGIVGALCYTWSDTFWFSAVEGEVYAYSSMFTALVFWLILKWEDHADEPHSDRWLVLIAYLVGLSIGVHLLNLLCLPAIALVYYYKRQPNSSLKGSIVAVGVGMFLVAAVLFGIVPGIVKVGGWFEIFFVNFLGLGFNMGVIIYLLLLIGVVLTAVKSTLGQNRVLTNILYILSVALLGIPFFGSGSLSIVIGIVLIVVLYFALKFKTKDGNFLLRKRFLNTSLLCMLMLMIGYSSYAIVVIRSVANPPMDQNSPEDIFSLGTYLSREQYGDKPLLFGPAFTSYQYAAPQGAINMKKRSEWHRVEKTSANEKDSYESVESNVALKFPSALQMFFPRIFDYQKASGYMGWLNNDLSMHDVTFSNNQGMLCQGQMPSQWDNLRFFMNYQNNFMYWRYFMWNFAGRQNKFQGNGDLLYGNAITGIPFIDNMMYGDQSRLPDFLKHDNGRNVFFLLPLLLGLLGIFYQGVYKGRKGVEQFWVVALMFFMTGLAIILYINQGPQEPRERDYAYAGSFYAFAIWIGLGVIALARLIEKKFNKNKSSIAISAIASVLAVFVPIQMVSQTWDDHDRSGRYACRDFGLDYLNTMPRKLADGTPACPIIFTNGDNDTFPLWYNQEVEGQRTDTRVCNLQYLQTEWYTDQMKRPAYDSPALPIAWDRTEYVDNGKHSYFPIRPEGKAELDEFKKAHPNGPDPYDLKYIIDNYVRKKGYIPTDSVVVEVNKANVLNQGITVPAGQEIPSKISLSLKWALDRSGGMYRSDMMIYEMLARNEWKRPIYMSVTLGYSNYAGLQDYLSLEGMAYRITPFKQKFGTADTQKMYDNLMHNFKFGNVSQKGIFLDETNLRMCQSVRQMYNILAQQLLREGKRKEALDVLRKGEKEMPTYNIPYDKDELSVAMLWQQAGDLSRAKEVAKDITLQNLQFLEWGATLNTTKQAANAQMFFRNWVNVLQGLELLKTLQSPDEKVILQRFNLFKNSTMEQIVMQQAQAMQNGQNASTSEEEE